MEKGKQQSTRNAVVFRAYFLKCIRELLQNKEMKRWMSSRGMNAQRFSAITTSGNSSTLGSGMSLSLTSTTPRTNSPRTIKNKGSYDWQYHSFLNLFRAYEAGKDRGGESEGLDSDEIDSLLECVHIDHMTADDLGDLFQDIKAIGNLDAHTVVTLFLQTANEIGKKFQQQHSPPRTPEQQQHHHHHHPKHDVPLLPSINNYHVPGGLVALTVRRRHLLHTVMGKPQDRNRMQLKEALPERKERPSATDGAVSLENTATKARQMQDLKKTVKKTPSSSSKKMTAKLSLSVQEQQVDLPPEILKPSSMRKLAGKKK